MAWLGEELAEDQQDGATSFAPRCLKDLVEEELRGGAISSARSIWCSWTRPASISKAQAARRWDGAASPKTIGRTSTK